MIMFLLHPKTHATHIQLVAYRGDVAKQRAAKETVLKVGRSVRAWMDAWVDADGKGKGAAHRCN